MKQVGYEALSQQHKNLLQILGEAPEHLLACDTYQFSDYSRYEASRFDAAHKARVKAEQFPIDCQKALEMGARLLSI